MKKLLSIACASTLLVTGMASLASASDTVWNFKFEGGTAAGAVAARGSTAIASSSTTAGVIDDPATKDAKDTGNPAAAMDPVVVSAWYRPSWTSLGTPPWAWLTDTRTPLGTGTPEAGQTSNYVKTWKDLVVWTTPGFDTTANPNFYLHVIPSTGTSLPPVVLNGKTIAYRLVMTQWPANYVGAKSFVLNTAAETLITLTSAGTTASDPITGTGPLTGTQTVGYRFNFVTPEPGSMLVLASGLSGLVHTTG